MAMAPVKRFRSWFASLCWGAHEATKDWPDIFIDLALWIEPKTGTSQDLSHLIGRIDVVETPFGDVTMVKRDHGTR